jgi:hypothetical protein
MWPMAPQGYNKAGGGVPSALLCGGYFVLRVVVLGSVGN